LVIQYDFGQKNKQNLTTKSKKFFFSEFIFKLFCFQKKMENTFFIGQKVNYLRRDGIFHFQFCINTQ